MVIEELNKRQSVPVSSGQGANPEIAGGDIIIAPYCHAEDHGIVVWFWCQSKNAQNCLQSMYSSGALLEKLLTIFKQFSNDRVPSGSQLLVPTSITIYAGDFTKNKSEFQVFFICHLTCIHVRYLRFDIHVSKVQVVHPYL